MEPGCWAWRAPVGTGVKYRLKPRKATRKTIGKRIGRHRNVIPGRCSASNPESRGSPMCNCTSEVHAMTRVPERPIKPLAACDGSLGLPDQLGQSAHVVEH